MLIKPEYFRKMVRIWRQPELSPRAKLLISRRLARQYDLIDEIDGLLLSRLIRDLKKGLPFTKSKIDKLEQDYRNQCALRQQARLVIGEWLMSTSADIEKKIGVSGICDALAVNPVHRRGLTEAKKGRALDYIAFVAGLEDSATHKNAKRQSPVKEGPLFHCVLELMVSFSLEHPELMPDPFAPNGPLYGKPIRMVDGNGQVFTTRPALTLHDKTIVDNLLDHPGKEQPNG